MDNNGKVPIFSLYIFVIFNNYIVFKYYVFPYLYDNFGRLSYIVLFLMIIIAYLVMLFISNKGINNDYSKLVKEKKRYKYTLIGYLYLSTILILTLAIRVIHVNFFSSSKPILFFIFIIFGAYYISSIKKEGIINIFTFPSLVYFIFVIIAALFNNELKDYKQLLPISFNIKFDDIFFILAIIFLIIDNYIFVLVSKSLKKPLTRKIIFFSNLTWLLLSIFELIGIVLLAGEEFLKGYEFVGLLSYSLVTTFKYIGDFDFVYIYLISLFSLAKACFNMSLLSELTNTYEKKKRIIIPFLIIIPCLFLSDNFMFVRKNLHWFIITMLILYLPFFIKVLITRREYE